MENTNTEPRKKWAEMTNQERDASINNHHKYLIVQAIKAGKDFWNKPASKEEISNSYPTKVTDQAKTEGEPHKGINAVVLKAQMELEGFKTPIFATLKEIQDRFRDKGLQIKDDQKQKGVKIRVQEKDEVTGIKKTETITLYNVEQFKLSKEQIQDLKNVRDAQFPEKMKEYEKERESAQTKFYSPILIDKTIKEIGNYLDNAIHGRDHDGNQKMRQQDKEVQQKQEQKRTTKKGRER